MRWYYYTLFLVIVAYFPIDQVISSGEFCPNKTLQEKCVKDAEADWEIDRNKKNTEEKPWCCHQWQALECWEDLGKQCKPNWDKTQFENQVNFTRNHLKKACTDWPEDKCSGLKWWAITLIVLGSLAALALVGFLVYTFVSRRRSSRRYSQPK